MAQTNLTLYTICFLDALSLGFLLPILAYRIFTLEGSHTVLGVLGTFYTTFQCISGPLVRSWRDVLGEKAVLFLTLLINFVTYIPLGLTESYVIVVLLRLICGLTNQSQTICKACAAKFNAQEKHDGVYSVMSAFTVAGLVVGPIVGGKVYEIENGFYYISLLSAAALAICLVISLTLPNTGTDESKDTTSFVQKINEELYTSFYSLRNINWKEQWDIVVLKYLYIASTAVFFIKFSMLLKIHYKASPTNVGYTYAYQSILTFLSHFIAAFAKQRFSNSHTGLVSILFLVTIGFGGLCFAPTYDIYLASFILMIIAHTMIGSSWKQLFAQRSTKEHKIEGIEDTITTISSIVTPIVFGIFCDLYGHYALKAFVLLPLIFNLFILIVNTPTPTKPVQKEKEK